ncbi:UDP-2,4-diacetamido-2,4,6-trideoxy-beta-L-altropyranose hydrolase [Paraglaciecola aestuariivivens]
MRVAFRVEGTPKLGLGHIMRCMALAQGLHKAGHQVFFFMSEVSSQFCQNRSDWLGEIIPLIDLDPSKQPEWLVEQCCTLKVDWLVLDGYQFEQSYRRFLSSKHFKLAVFDDLNNSGELYADLVINGAPKAHELNYLTKAPNAKLAIGSQFQVLRQEFFQVERNNWSSRNNLSLMFGGSDPKNMTIKLLAALQKQAATMPITVITGAAYENLPQLTHLLKHSQLKVKHIHNCQNMAKELVHSKLAVSAAGGSQFELLACAVPAFLVVVANNQLPATQAAANQGWCHLIKQDEAEIDELAKQCLSVWQNPELLQQMHKLALAQPVIDGAQNIAQLMLAQTQQSERPR